MVPDTQRLGWQMTRPDADTHRRLPITRWTRDEGAMQTTDAIAVERTVEIAVAGATVARLQCMPRDLEDLAIGFVLTNGIVSRLDLIAGAVVSDDGARVDVDAPALDGEELTRLVSRMALAAGCGKAVFAPEIAGRFAAPLGPGFGPERVLEAVHDLSRRGEVFAQTGSVHSAAAWRGDELVAFREDIARHNAVDKIAGAAFRAGSDLNGCLLVSSGRITSEIVLKGIRLGVWGIASRSAATDRAILAAADLGMFVAGFVRAGRMNVYCGAGRLGS